MSRHSEAFLNQDAPDDCVPDMFQVDQNYHSNLETNPDFQFCVIILLCDWLDVGNTRTANVVRMLVRHLKALRTLFKLVIHKLPL